MIDSNITFEIKHLLEQIRQHRPVVHCITNIVTVNDCANSLLALGAAPTMAHHPLEVEEITSGCQSLICNLGALDDFEAMKKAIQMASALHHPIVVDPVGVGASQFRRNCFFELKKLGNITCVRGNLSEMRALLLDATTAIGVDVSSDDIHVSEMETSALAVKLAKRLGCTVIISGAMDVISDGIHCVGVENGDIMMSRITGSGCMSSVLLGAFLSQTDTPWKAAVASCCIMGICGELAAKKCHDAMGGTMTFRMMLIDMLSQFQSSWIDAYARLKFLPVE
ncbi:MAG: hydroxyethylthiazole kinase [Lachnospiraceae bacterium]